LFKTVDGGRTWRELPALRSAKGHLWQPGAGGMAVHTIILDPQNANRIFLAISAAGVFRMDDGGKAWKPVNRGMKSPYELPDPDAEVGHCVHRIAMHPSRPGVLFMQKHWDVLRGTMRDHATLKRRPYVRFFACKEDLSGNPPETRLPDAVVSGAEPFLIVGAMAGD
jgi:hypothetical protein